MSPAVQLLETTGTALREALAKQDWSVIGTLDLQCRQAVDDAMVETGRDEAELRLRMQELVDLYRELVLVCQSEQQRLSQELVKLNQSQQSAKVYQMFV
jgi:flagellar protein FliT